MNLVLIGYRGTGKSQVARLLSDILHRPVVSLDEEIVRTSGATIPEIVEQSGWDHFRDLETEAVRRTCARDGLIVDSGGGVILRDENVRLLRHRGFVVLLLASTGAIVERIAGGTDRPSLTGTKSFVEEVEDVVQQRMASYRAAADLEIDTTALPPEEVARAIVRELQARKIIRADRSPA